MKKPGISTVALLSGALLCGTAMVSAPTGAIASTYVVYIPVDDPIYTELDTLNDLGYLDSYLPEIKPISRVEAARLAIEARNKLRQAQAPDAIAQATLNVLWAQVGEEISWLENNEEDRLPTMVRPIQRLEMRYVYSSGQRRKFNVETNGPATVTEATPLLPNNSDLPTSNGNNGAAIWEGWAGVGGFLTGYGEGALAGPLRQDHNAPDRDRIVSGAAVLSLGNVALSFGNEQMEWGVGYYAQLSQSANASAFPALRLQNVHPTHLPWFLRYLGPFRWQAFFGQLDNNRAFASPWIDGEIVAFKPLPTFEFGFTHTIMFGGLGNNNYSLGGFVGRATGFATGNPLGANTNTRVSAFVRMRFPSLRGTQLYGEILGEDFYQPLGHNTSLKLPFKGPSYQLGVYLPRLTRDGLTDARLEWALLDKEYSVHNDSLYWTYDGRLMGDPLGPHAQRVDLALGRWFGLRYKADVDGYYELRQPGYSATGGNNENGEGIAVDLMRLPVALKRLDGALGDFQMRTAVEYASDVNYLNHKSVRALLTLTIGLTPQSGLIKWR
jgi:hypothetical protein